MELRRSPSGPLADVGGAAICFRPGLASDGPNVATWAEVEEAITGADGYITVYVDDTNEAALVPADADTDCFGRVTFLGAQSDAISFLTVEDGGVIRNPNTFSGLLVVRGSPTSTPFIALDGSGSPELTIDNAELMTVGGSQPAVNVTAGQTVIIRLLEFGILGDGAHAAVNVEDAGILELFCFNGGGPNTDSISGGASSAVTIIGDDTCSSLNTTFASLLSTPARQRASQASLNEPARGPTGSRPTGISVITGQMFFDSDLGKPVWWDGAQWVLATGVPA